MRLFDHLLLQAISARNRENQARNEHPHHLGSGGYATRENQYIKEQIKQSLLSGSSSEKPTLTPRPRHESWIEGRKDKTGRITNKKTQAIVDLIVSISFRLINKYNVFFQ